MSNSEIVMLRTRIEHLRAALLAVREARQRRGFDRRTKRQAHQVMRTIAYRALKHDDEVGGRS